MQPSFLQKFHDKLTTHIAEDFPHLKVFRFHPADLDAYINQNLDLVSSPTITVLSPLPTKIHDNFKGLAYQSISIRILITQCLHSFDELSAPAIADNLSQSLHHQPISIDGISGLLTLAPSNPWKDLSTDQLLKLELTFNLNL